MLERSTAVHFAKDRGEYRRLQALLCGRACESFQLSPWNLGSRGQGKSGGVGQGSKIS